MIDSKPVCQQYSICRKDSNEKLVAWHNPSLLDFPPEVLIVSDIPVRELNLNYDTLKLVAAWKIKPKTTHNSLINKH